MELRKFISESLKDILGGISDAQSEVEKGQVVPFIDETLAAAETGLTSYQTVDFEISVNAVEKEGSEAKLNVVAAVIGGHVKGDSSQTASHSATLKFKVPIRVPIAD
ncbi:hypothetical protein [Vibrio vulnificus]|uniref:hypothetical protein n=1 Tax=Vibrio vulnificus TaxID=672 RepID=UPI0009B6ED70|nr:hypothetical protein [Vibrio vulnificus]EHK2775591.1 hypothetical protein [Vibrio vulnificus]EHK8978222.1 hypothetical protein [Vibrio vulnificus]EHK9005389.1 hypothetical protein [Vibrio vulnificus]EHK9046079.1 hypothetical protein [Vibrio vulnificus]EJB0234731.1 hypothetical protein [Vibrio vulnificus]